MKFSELKIGQKASLTKTITKQDVLKFAEASGDVNPIHTDEAAAQKSVFGKPVAHGILALGLVSAVLGNKLPGAGTIYLGQDTKFTAPVFWGDEVTATVEVAELREDKRIAKLNTTCVRGDGTVVNTGVAVVKLAE
jgi:3-hydroxybutyryl-CoA dehydratase